MKTASVSSLEVRYYCRRLKGVNSRHFGGPGLGGDLEKEVRLELRLGRETQLATGSTEGAVPGLCGNSHKPPSKSFVSKQTGQAYRTLGPAVFGERSDFILRARSSGLASGDGGLDPGGGSGHGDK